jgi:hypothetical protein
MTRPRTPPLAIRSVRRRGLGAGECRRWRATRGIVRSLAFAIGAWAFMTTAWAQAPVALVEDVTGNPAGVSFMDYVQAGKVIQLGPKETIVLSYFSTCLREVIQGGSIRVGAEQSDVTSGHVERTTVDCEASKMLDSVGQTNDSASLIIRGHRPTTIEPAPPAEFTLYGVSPFIELRGDGTLVIARLDKAGEYFKWPIEQQSLMRGAFFDLATDGKSLTPGGTYGARWGKHLTVFKIDPNAKPGQTPIVGRLLRLVSAS